MNKSLSLFGNKKNAQNEPIPGKRMVKNNAGGYVFQQDDWKSFERFLIMGTEGGTYYVSEKALTRENANKTLACIANDGLKAVRTIVEISDSGRAAKNDPAIFALAMAASAESLDTRQAALAALPKVCRIPTHLFHFVTYVKNFRGFGRGLRTALAKWYNEKDLQSLAFHGVKYQSRDGWANADVLRLAHPKTADEARNMIYSWMLGGMERVSKMDTNSKQLPEIIEVFEDAKTASGASLINLIRDHNLTREMVPSESLKDPKVWEVLLEKMPPEAMIRNLGNMSKNGLLAPLSDASNLVISRLTNREGMKKARIHPIQIQTAMKVYGSGRAMKGDGVWKPVPSIMDALDSAFYESFNNVEPTRKRILVGLDVSRSMTMGQIVGSPLLPYEAAAGLAMVVVRTEPNYHVMGFSDRFVDLGITPRMRLDDILAKTRKMAFGRTDCALPMVWAIQGAAKVDAFVTITDNETWYGQIHPTQALSDYRRRSGISAKSIVIACTPNEFTIADPNDPLSLDISGFDTNIPKFVGDFIR